MLLLCGCAFNPPEIGVTEIEDIAHLPPDAEAVGGGDLIFTENSQILTGTDAPEIVGVVLPDGVTFTTSGQDAVDGREVAVLHVRDLTIAADVIVRAQGSRPLVIVADTVDIAGVLDASAIHDRPGAGGFGPGMGPGAGADGSHVDGFEDGGGGGGGFFQAGGRGGDVDCGQDCVRRGGEAGSPYGDVVLSVLQAGSGGGFPGDHCRDSQPPPGAGGGAVQISALTSITIASGAGINAGGGGGGRGEVCEFWGAGSGGGSGGAIFLQSPRVTHEGILAANGGGGGGASGDPDNDGFGPQNGENGDNGLMAVQSAQGGAGQPFWGASGGAGGYGDMAAQPGGDEPLVGGNGGGGGGGAGYIVVFTSTGLMEGEGQSSPTARVGPVVGE